MNHSAPEFYDRADSITGWLSVGVWALAILAGVLLLVVCVGFGRALYTRRHKRAHRAWKVKK